MNAADAPAMNGAAQEDMNAENAQRANAKDAQNMNAKGAQNMNAASAEAMRLEVRKAPSGAGQEGAVGADIQAPNAAGAAWKMCRAPFS